MAEALDPQALDALDARISAWLADQLATNPVVAAVERDLESGERRWFVRLRGEQKGVVVEVVVQVPYRNDPALLKELQGGTAGN